MTSCNNSLDNNLQLHPPPKEGKKLWKISPPPKQPIPVQYCRSYAGTTQQAGNPPELELFEPSPRFYGRRQTTSSFPVRRSRCSIDVEKKTTNDAQSREVQNQRTKSRYNRRISSAASFSILALTVALLNLINMSARNFSRWTNDRRTNSITLTYISNSFSGNQKAIRHIHPRVSFIRSDRSTPSLSLSSRHRSVRVYEAEFTDVTQLYSIKSSDDTAVSSSIERKYFPDHEVNHDCIPMSDWQTLSFREYQRWGLYCLLISRTHNDISLFAITATCNSFHETAILDFTLVGSGSWRDTWINDGDADNIIVKTIR